jgi:hypothetical protein
MKIPQDLEELYSHWEYHSSFEPNLNYQSESDLSVLKQIEWFITKRMEMWEMKTSNQSRLYFSDPILSTYRFCNIYRELDRQTIHFHKMLLPIKDDFELWLLNMVFCRFICKPETVSKIGLLSFDSNNNQKVYSNLKQLDSPKFGDAYVFPISLIIKGEYNSRESFFCLYLPKVIKECAKIINSFKKESTVKAIAKILPVFGYNFKFHWTEIVIDIAYQYPDLIDLYKDFPIGPGSIPTMLMLDSNSNPEKTCLELKNIVLKSFPYLEYRGKKILLSTENWEGIGCEFRKYTNLKNNTGRKRIYQPFKKLNYLD